MGKEWYPHPKETDGIGPFQVKVVDIVYNVEKRKERRGKYVQTISISNAGHGHFRNE